MNAHQIREFCLTFPGCTEEVQWEDHLLYKVGGKIFVISGMETFSAYSLKCTEETFNELIEIEGIIPAPYLARNKWVQINPDLCDLKRKKIESLITDSYNLIFSKLPKKVQATIKKD
jgi:predicted DNA-binding protein (MmcQ/YjbR family)